MLTNLLLIQLDHEKKDLYKNFIGAIHEVNQKASLKNLLLEKKLKALAEELEIRETQMTEIIVAANLDPVSLVNSSRRFQVYTILDITISLTFITAILFSIFVLLFFLNLVYMQLFWHIFEALIPLFVGNIEFHKPLLSSSSVQWSTIIKSW